MENSTRPPLFSASFTAKCITSGVEFLFLFILVGSISIVVGFMVSFCSVLVHLAVRRQIIAVKGRWKHALLWVGGLGGDFILISVGLAVLFHFLGAKVFTNVSGLSEIAIVAGLLTGGLAAVGALTFAAIMLVDLNQKAKATKGKQQI